METTLADLSPHELEELITTAIDRRMEVWLTQLLDAVGGAQEEDVAALQPEFETSFEKYTNASRLYLSAPVNAIVEGIYEEHVPFSEIKRHGDFGLGTFDLLDGEMVMLDGRVFQMRADGSVEEVGDDALTPFSCVTFYRPQQHADLDGETSYDDFLARLQAPLPSPNIFYAFRIEGDFAYMKVRSVPKSECYIPLVEIAKEQPVFEFSDIRGTLAGFYTPEFMASVSVPGMHLHFLSDDLAHGGHLLECRPRQVRAGVQALHTVELALPTTSYYLGWDFRRDVAGDLEKAEK